MDINSAENGMYLSSDTLSGGINHRTLHTTDYYDKINNKLSCTQNWDETIDILNDIAEQLSNGTF